MKQTYLASSSAHSPAADRQKPWPLFGAVLVTALVATACASASGKYDWRQGWHEARVVKIGIAAALGGRHFSDCRYSAGTQQAVSGQFAVLSYEHMGRWRRRVVPLHEGEAYRPGDLVYMNVNSCGTPLVKRARTVQK